MGFIAALGIGDLRAGVTWAVIAIGCHANRGIVPEFLGFELMFDEQLARHVQDVNVLQFETREFNRMALLHSQDKPELLGRRDPVALASIWIFQRGAERLDVQFANRF